MSKRVSDAIIRYAEPVFYLFASLSIGVGGTWVVGNFVYQEWLKPTYLEPPSVMASGTLQKLGQYHGSTVLGYWCTIRNTAAVNAAIVAFAITANGYHYTRLDAPHGERDKADDNYRRYGGNENITPLYRWVERTGFATGSDQTGLYLAPGESYSVMDSFLVKKNTYDAVKAYASLGYAKDASPGSEPTGVKFIYKNIVRFFGKADPKYIYNETQVGQIGP